MWKTNTSATNSKNAVASIAVALSTFSPHRALSLERINRGRSGAEMIILLARKKIWLTNEQQLRDTRAPTGGQ